MIKHVFLILITGLLFSYSGVAGYKAWICFNDKENKSETELEIYTVNDLAGPFIPQKFGKHEITLKNYPTNGIRIRGTIEVSIDNKSVLCAPPKKGSTTKVDVDKFTHIIIKHDHE